MKKLYYETGPPRMGFGLAGVFFMGVPKEVDDHLAEILLAKGELKEWKDPGLAKVEEVIQESPSTKKSKGRR